MPIKCKKMPSHPLIFFIKKLKQYYSPKVNGLGPREKPKEGVFINSKLESVDIFLGESEPDPDSCRLSCADTEEILRCNVPEFIVDESFGDEFGAGLGDPIGKEAKHIIRVLILDPIITVFFLLLSCVILRSFCFNQETIYQFKFIVYYLFGKKIISVSAKKVFFPSKFKPYSGFTSRSGR